MTCHYHQLQLLPFLLLLVVNLLFIWIPTPIFTSANVAQVINSSSSSKDLLLHYMLSSCVNQSLSIQKSISKFSSLLSLNHTGVIENISILQLGSFNFQLEQSSNSSIHGFIYNFSGTLHQVGISVERRNETTALIDDDDDGIKYKIYSYNDEENNKSVGVYLVEFHSQIPNIIIRLEGNYSLNGSIGILNLHGHGAYWIKIYNLAVNGTCTMRFLNNNSSSASSNPSIQIDQLQFDLYIDDVQLELFNLFPRNHLLGNAVNRLLNQHSMILFNETKSELVNSINQLAQTYMNEILADLSWNNHCRSSNVSQ